MSYLVLARKWRPRKFAELVGQDHVVRALSNALDSDRVHHAVLFTGTRGVGKTTIARIFAKALNCDTGVSATPCGVCAACLEIDEGRFVDLIEVDAASRTKVEDTRELLENVLYAPSRGRYKVYLIDEVHMLSGSSFNALLKTLEEPPPHVKFLLATTDPQKLPATVLSRCLQFHLKRLPANLIAERMAEILTAESVAHDAGALALLSRAADGSLRDALSLLDQALVFGAGSVTEADVRSMLGTIDREHVIHLLDCLIAADSARLFAALQLLDEQAPDYDQVLVELALLIERLTLTQLVPNSGADAGFDSATLTRLAAAIAAEDLQLYYQICILGRRDLSFAPEPRIGFEMTLLRMLAFRPMSASEEMLAAVSESAAPAPRVTSVASSARTPVRPNEQSVDRPASVADDWQQMLGQLGVSGAAHQLGANCSWVGREGNVVRLRLDKRSEALRTPSTEERLAQAVAKYLGSAVQLVIERDEADVIDPVVRADTPARRDALGREQEIAQARAALDADPAIRALKEQFGASLQTNTVKPAR
jgi:DNA polymerase-3 subunit gamma/tau